MTRLPDQSASQVLGHLGQREVPAAVLDQAVDRLLDFAGLRGLAARWPEVEIVAAQARHAAGDDPAGRAPDHPLPAGATALVDATAVHATGLDDFHRPTNLHPMAPVVAAALASADRSQAIGRQLLRAIVAGYEVACRLGRSVPAGALHRRGFHPTSVFGALGAAAAAAVARGLDGEATAQAIGLAATRAAGLATFDPRAWTKALQVGWAAQAGWDAAGLAAAGFPAPPGILESRGGFLATLAGPEGFDPGPLVAEAPEWAIGQVAYKPYAHSTDLHSAVDAVLDACRAGGLDGRQVARVEVGLPTVAYQATAAAPDRQRAPATVRAARLSVYFAVAAALRACRPGGGVETFHDWFTEARLGDPALLDLGARVTACPDPALEPGPAAGSPAWAVVTARDGRRLEARVADHRGSPGRPFRRQDLVFRLRHLRPDGEALAAALQALPAAASTSAASRLLRANPDPHPPTGEAPK